MRVVIAVVFALLSWAAIAQTGSWRGDNGAGYVTPPYPTAIQAEGDMRAAYAAYYGVGGSGACLNGEARTYNWTNIQAIPYGELFINSITLWACPAPGPYGNMSQYVTYTFTIDELCQEGVESSIVITRGYMGRDPNGGVGYADYLPSGAPNPDPGRGASPVPSAMCVGGCMATLGPATDYYSSRQPTSTGLYRLASQHTARTTGGERCTQSDSDRDLVDETRGVPPCNGAFGYIDGRPACVPTSTPSGTGTATATTPFGGGGPVTQGNPPSGGGGGAATGNGGNGGGPGHPGDGRRVLPDGTVVDGTATGSTPSGTRTKSDTEEQVACGAPGQPKCRIDETGTPADANGRFSGANASIDQSKSGIDGLINGASSKAAPGWTWSFALPSNCAPIQTPAFADFVSEIDLCGFQDTIHDLMALLWLACTIWSCVGMVGSTLRGA